jgi:hypothetical protein
MEPKPKNPAIATIARESCLKVSVGERFSVTTPAERLPAGSKRLTLPNYRGQTPRFMRLFYSGKGRMVSRAVPRQSAAENGCNCGVDPSTVRLMSKAKPSRTTGANLVPNRSDASKKEAVEFSARVQEGVRYIEKSWWSLASLVDECLRRHVPAAMGMNAKSWMEKYLEGSLTDTFRKLRIFRRLAGVPRESVEAMKQANAEALCRLPERERISPEWVEKATTTPIKEFREQVDHRLEEKGIIHEKFVLWSIRIPESLAERFEEAEKKVAFALTIDIETNPGNRILVWEAIAVLVNDSQLSIGRLKQEIEGEYNRVP